MMVLFIKNPKDISQDLCLLLQNGSAQQFKSKPDHNDWEDGSLPLSHPTT